MFKLKQLDNLIQFSKWWWTVSWITFRYKAHVHRDDMCPSAHSTFGVLFITVALLWLNERWCEKQRDGVSSMKFYFLPFPLLLGGFWGRCSVCWCVRCCCVSYTMPVKTMPFFSFFFFSSPLAHLSGKQKCLLSVGGSAKDFYTQRKNKWGKKEKEKQQQQKKNTPTSQNWLPLWFFPAAHWHSGTKSERSNSCFVWHPSTAARRELCMQMIHEY